MLIRLVGPDVPDPMLMAFPTVIDHAKVRPADVHYDQVTAVVTVPMRLACKIDILTVGPPIDEVEQLFGAKIDSKSLYACSADEYHGKPLLEIEATFSVRSGTWWG